MVKELIPKYDIHGVQLHEGDIVAEGKLGELIWDGQGIIRERPLGVVIYKWHSNLKNGSLDTIDTLRNGTSWYNVCELRNGIAELTDVAGEHLMKSATSQKMIEFTISHHDHLFQAWDDIEIIGSIYELDELNNHMKFPQTIGDITFYDKKSLIKWISEAQQKFKERDWLKSNNKEISNNLTLKEFINMYISKNSLIRLWKCIENDCHELLSPDAMMEWEILKLSENFTSCKVRCITDILCDHDKEAINIVIDTTLSRKDIKSEIKDLRLRDTTEKI